MSARFIFPPYVGSLLFGFVMCCDSGTQWRLHGSTFYCYSHSNHVGFLGEQRAAVTSPKSCLAARVFVVPPGMGRRKGIYSRVEQIFLLSNLMGFVTHRKMVTVPTMIPIRVSPRS